jgi:hypothetical protein
MGFRRVRSTRSPVTASHLLAMSPGSRICSPAVRSPVRTDRRCPVGALPRRARAGMRIELQARLVGDFGGNAAQRVGRPGRHGGRARRAAVLGSSRASTPVGPSRARVVDQISMLDVRSVFGDGSLLAALSRGARGCALCAATSQPDRGGRYVHPRDGRLEGRCYPTEGVPHFPASRRRLDCGEALGGEVYGLGHRPGCRGRGRADAARGHWRHLAADRATATARLPASPFCRSGR